jgi:5-methylcytosine-specific restriction endonuclease McrA
MNKNSVFGFGPKATEYRSLPDAISKNQLSLQAIMTRSDGIQHFLVDNALANNWINHHDTMAEFRVLCKQCNSRNGTYGYRRTCVSSVPVLEA